MATATLEHPEVSVPAECPPTVEVDTRKLFAILTASWQSDTHWMIFSDPGAVLKNPAFQMTIALGKSVVPLIFREYEKEEHAWAVALASILRVNPVPEEHYGRMGLIREDWLKWGRANGYL